MPLTYITLSSHRGIALTSLRLDSTYAGLLEGAPTKHVNDRIIEYRLREARDAYPGRPVHLVPPPRTQGDRTALRGEPVENLPAVVCIGAFDSKEIDPAHNSGWYSSALVVVWFQDTPDIPSNDNAPAALRDIPWDEVAQDFED
ncbi:hypothetical protein [Streptomyces sp. NPDC006012]|uniref:hypothetical protein n=1 Tax=Streptomyces sp. NPDC006012 TaxID=3364739 RepID=UPI003684AAC8